jgi:VWFA-related protein
LRRALAAGALVLAQAPVLAGQTPAPPVFGASLETVYVDAFVTRDGRSVPGLDASHFELKDNGVVQEVELVAGDSLPLLAVLAFDTSSSVAGDKLAALQAAGAAFLDGLNPRDQAALLTFSQQIEWRAGPTTDGAHVRRALQALRPRGATAALDGLYAAITLPVAQARTLVVLFSDGEDNLSWLGEKEVRAVAERSNALVHVVGLHPSDLARSLESPRVRPAAPPEPQHLRVLRQIAEATGGRLWQADSPDRLRHAFAAIAEAMSHRYILRYEPRGVARGGWHRIELRLRRGKGEVRARRGYWVGGA